MSRQMQPQGMGGQTQQQSGTMGGQMTEGMGQTTEMVLPQEIRSSLTSVSEAVQVCGWCAEMCTQEADPMMIDCIKLCEDVTEIGETLLALAPRNSYFTQELARTFQQAAQACAQECRQHDHNHCQECAMVLDQAVQATQGLAGTQRM